MMEKRNTIKLPYIYKSRKPYDCFHVIFSEGRYEVLKVTPKSLIGLRSATEKIAVYFRREFSYDFVQFNKNSDSNYVAYLFVDCYEVVGACCFRLRSTKHKDQAVRDRWWLDWAWFHPYFRNKGIFSEFAPIIKLEYPECIFEPPLSKTMVAFMKKHGFENKV